MEEPPHMPLNACPAVRSVYNTCCSVGSLWNYEYKLLQATQIHRSLCLHPSHSAPRTGSSSVYEGSPS